MPSLCRRQDMSIAACKFADSPVGVERAPPVVSSLQSSACDADTDSVTDEISRISVCPVSTIHNTMTPAASNLALAQMGIQEFEEYVPLQYEFESAIILFKSLSGLHRIEESRRDSAVELLSSESTLTWWNLFLGGFARFDNRCLQSLYDMFFLLSFVSCFASCGMNIYYFQPPFFTTGIAVATSYFHIVGMHQWLFWRRFVDDQGFILLLKSFTQTSERASRVSRASLKRVYLAWGATSMVLQFIFIGIGMVVFPVSAHNLVEVEGDNLPNRFAKWHAVLMWIAIPQHVALVVMSIALFQLLTNIHALDFARMCKTIADSDFKLLTEESETPAESRASLNACLQACCLLVESSQNRLDHSCRSVQCLLLHQIVYAAVILIVGFLSIAEHVVDLKNSSFSSQECWLTFGVDAWLTGIGIYIHSTCLIWPAYLTGLVKDTPRSIHLGLRQRGYSIVEIAEKMDLGVWEWLRMECIGYRLFNYAMTDLTVIRFSTIVLIVGSILASGTMYRND